MQNQFSPQMSVSSLIKARPIAIGELQKSQIRFWDVLEKSLGELFPTAKLKPLLEVIEKTPVAEPTSEWSTFPLYTFIDYLCFNHRQILIEEVAEISHILEIHSLSDSPEALELKDFKKAFDTFVREFEGYIVEEDNFLFPRILRYEACLRDRNVNPEFHRGSLQSYLATPKSKDKRKFYQEAVTLAYRIRTLEARMPNSLVAKELTELMDSLSEKLTDHLELENKALFTTARDLERHLYNMTIDGQPALTHSI